MNADTLAALGAVALSVLTALGTLYRGVRRRERDKAVAPFIAGKAAIEEAQTALAWKDRRLTELTESEANLKTQLAGAVATSAAQQEQITHLQAEMWQLKSQYGEVLSRAETAERREREARERITQLEDTVGDLKRKLALGGPPYS